MIRRIWKVAFLVIFLLGAVVALSHLTGPPVAAQGRTNLVLAFYYAWYNPESFGAGKTAFQPPEPYSSNDVATIQRQVSQAQGAGIDGFVQSWYGPAEPVTNGNFQTLLDVAAGSGFKAAIDFEPATALGSHDERAAALQNLLATHATHPAYLKVDGKPVIFFWANWAYSVEEWAYIRNIADPGRSSIWIAEGARTEYLEVFDGLHLYNIAWSPNPHGIASNWAANTRAAAETYGGHKYWVGTAMPGFDDRHLGRGEAAVYRDRAGGAYYQNSFAAAAASNPDLLIITSFNEWAEGSNIEPSTAFGGTYLDLTAQLVSGYKSGGVPQPPPLPETNSESPPPTAEAPAEEEDNSGEVSALLAQDATATPAQDATPLASPTAQADGRIIYEVAEGDTLSAIAARFGLTLQELYAMNDLDEDSVLTLGQEIVLGISDEPAEEGEGEPLPPGVEVGPDDTLVYQVQENDTLVGIAVEHDLELEELLALNPTLTEDSLLQLGQDIVVGERRQPGSTGGSTDLPEGMATTEVTATETVTAASPTPAVTPSVVAATPTEALAVVEDTATPPSAPPGSEEQAVEEADPPAGAGNRPIPSWLIAVGAFVFVTGLSGAVLFYLGSRQSK
ncbi:MAG: endo-1,3-alpha-glucanase family glycosylhydrolase [Chloroflexota bacterium]